MVLEAKVRRIGTGYGILIPKRKLEEIGAKEGDVILVKRIEKPTRDIRGILKGSGFSFPARVRRQGGLSPVERGSHRVRRIRLGRVRPGLSQGREGGTSSGDCLRGFNARVGAGRAEGIDAQARPSTTADGTVVTFVRSRTVVTEIDAKVAEVASDMSFKQKKKTKDWGMLDSFVLAVAMVKGGKIITGDPHFKGMDRRVIYIGD